VAVLCGRRTFGFCMEGVCSIGGDDSCIVWKEDCCILWK
jgi:hypothetical protein